MQNINVRNRKPYRDRVSIVAEILEMACDGVQRTSIMYRVGMSSLMLNRYLGFMMNARLLDIALSDGRVVLRATDRGKEFLRHCYEIIQMLETGDDGHKPSRRIELFPTSLPVPRQ
jgi:predicted transcriptional regulator